MIIDKGRNAMNQEQENDSQKESYSSVNVAHYILNLSGKIGLSLDLMKLIKLVYISHGYFLAKYGRPLVNEQAEAWLFGPVFPEVYKRLRPFMNAEKELMGPFKEIPEENFSKDAIKEIKYVFEKFKDVYSGRLSVWTHEKRTPWWTTKFYGDEKISDQNIRLFYKEMINNGENYESVGL